MGDMADDFRFLRARNRERKAKNLAAANPEGWTQHTEYHWSRDLAGSRLDYWPSRNKFQYQGRVMTGDVNGFIRKRTK
jgi:hypothetical protein